MKEWNVYVNGRWLGYARAGSAAEAIEIVKARYPAAVGAGRWSAR